jgi:hypothetical protein
MTVNLQMLNMGKPASNKMYRYVQKLTVIIEDEWEYKPLALLKSPQHKVFMIISKP